MLSPTLQPRSSPRPSANMGLSRDFRGALGHSSFRLIGGRPVAGRGPGAFLQPGKDSAGRCAWPRGVVGRGGPSGGTRWEVALPPGCDRAVGAGRPSEVSALDSRRTTCSPVARVSARLPSRRSRGLTGLIERARSAGQPCTSTAPTSSMTAGTSTSATTSWIFGAARAAPSRRRRLCSARASAASALERRRERRAVAVGAGDRCRQRRHAGARAARDELAQDVVARRAELQPHGRGGELAGEHAAHPPPDLADRAPDRQAGADGDAQQVEHVGELLGDPPLARASAPREQRAPARRSPPTGAASSATSPSRPGSRPCRVNARQQRARPRPRPSARRRRRRRGRAARPRRRCARRGRAARRACRRGARGARAARSSRRDGRSARGGCVESIAWSATNSTHRWQRSAPR